jgi:hypothetical protein
MRGMITFVNTDMNGNNEYHLIKIFYSDSTYDLSRLEKIMVHAATEINKFFNIDLNIVRDKIAGMSLRIAPVSKTFGLTLAQTVALVTAYYIIYVVNFADEVDLVWFNGWLKFDGDEKNERLPGNIPIHWINTMLVRLMKEKEITQNPQATLLEFLEHLATFHGENSEEAIEKMYCDLFGIANIENEDYIRAFIVNLETYRDDILANIPK